MKEIKNYIEARKKIGELFGVDIWYNIVFELDSKWTDYGEKHGSVGWDLLSEDDGFNDTIEICGISRWETEDHVMFVGYDCCGNKDMYVFAKENYMEGQ